MHTKEYVAVANYYFIFLLLQITKQQFDETARSLLISPEDLNHHNDFFLAIIAKCNIRPGRNVTASTKARPVRANKFVASNFQVSRSLIFNHVRNIVCAEMPTTFDRQCQWQWVWRYVLWSSVASLCRGRSSARQRCFGRPDNGGYLGTRPQGVWTGLRQNHSSSPSSSPCMYVQYILWALLCESWFRHSGKTGAISRTLSQFRRSLCPSLSWTLIYPMVRDIRP